MQNDFTMQRTQTQTRCRTRHILTTSRISPMPTCRRCRTRWNHRFTWIFLQVRIEVRDSIGEVSNLVYANVSLSFIARLQPFRLSTFFPVLLCLLDSSSSKPSCKEKRIDKRKSFNTIWTSLENNSIRISSFCFLETTYQFSRRIKTRFNELVG